MPTVTPFLWFESEAVQAAKLYVSLFEKSKLESSDAQSATFTLAGRRYIAFNGGPHYRLNPAFSFFVACADQKEIDRYWKRLVKGGTELRCGWLTDRFGTTWQIVPAHIRDLIRGRHGMEAMLGMQKLDVRALERAAAKDRPAK